MNFPIPVAEFAKVIPHRPPMVWVDEVTRAEATEGECRVHLKPDALYMRGGRLLKTAPIEWMAQTFAFVQSAYSQQPAALKEAFLVSVRSARHLVPSGTMEKEPSLRVRVFNYRDLGPIVMFDGEVLSEAGVPMAQASLRIYRN